MSRGEAPYGSQEPGVYAGQQPGGMYDPSTGKVQSEDDQREVEEYLSRFEHRKSERINWENHWQEALDHIIPRKGDVVVTRQDGIKRGNELFDTTAIMANQTLAGALHGMLTNPALRFFELLAADVALNEQDDVKAWLQDCGDRMFQILGNSNFQTEVHEIYIDLGAIGTACLYMAEHPERIVHFSARNIKEVFLDENSEGLVDTMDRLFKWRPRQILQEFGLPAMPPEMLKKLNDDNRDEMEILHCVHPMSDGEIQAKSGIFKFKSVYIIKDLKFIVQRKNFHEFPFAVPRWTKTSGEKYGRGPGMDMLPDIKMVDKMMETTLKGAQKTVDPPLMVADDSVIGNVRLTPGGLTVIRPTSEVPIRPLITDARIDFGLQMIEGVRQRIRAGFYVDQLQLQEGPQMTATEVNQRTQEKLRIMGPVLGRQHFEFLRPLVDRLFGIMYRRGLLLPAPERLQGKKIDVRYSSLIARAQRADEGRVIMTALQTIAPLVSVKPEVLDNLNADKAFHYIMDNYGVPQKLMATSMEKKNVRESRQQAQDQANQMTLQQHQADIASKVGPATAQVMQASKAQ